MDNDQPPSEGWHAKPEDVDLARIIEREKTIRTVCITAGVVIGLITITVGVVRALDKPPWVQALSAILIALFGPSGVVYRLIKSRQRYVEKTHRRHVEFEKRVDPGRESSEPETGGRPEDDD